MKSARRRDLLKILHEGRASTQKDFVDALRAAGHDVTQATVSRDLQELGAVRVREEGRVTYRFPDGVPQLHGIRTVQRTLVTELEEFAIDICTAGNLVIVLTLPGHAAAVARAIDLARLDDVCGTIAGDDTIFVAAADANAAQVLSHKWRGATGSNEGQVSDGS